MTDNQKKLVLDWMRKVHTLEHAHRQEGISWYSYNNWLGIPSLIVAALIASLGSICEIKDELIISILSTVGGVIVAILVGIQTFLRPSEFAEKHRLASGTYEKLRHKIEYLLQFQSNEHDIEKLIDEIRIEWNNIDSINVSNKYFLLAKTWIKGLNKYPPELDFL